MSSHNKFVYHCITYGRIDHRDQEVEPPECCGHLMTNVGTMADQLDNLEGQRKRVAVSSGCRKTSMMGLRCFMLGLC
jgi:hypothetical protein